MSSTGSSRPTSSATAAKTSAGGRSRATSVATRRSAACSSASRCTSARACAFTIAVATSSVKRVMRTSVSPRERPAGRVDGQVAPDAALDEDRASDGRAQPELRPGVVGDRPGHVLPVVDPRGAARPQDPRREALPRERPLPADLRVGVHALGRPVPDGGHQVAGLVADRRGGVGLEEAPDLLRDGAEQLAGRYAACDERRDPPQRGLLVREPAELRLPCRGRERRRDQLA